MGGNGLLLERFQDAPIQVHRIGVQTVGCRELQEGKIVGVQQGILAVLGGVLFRQDEIRQKGQAGSGSPASPSPL